MGADQLRYFMVAARFEHFGRAADELGISQPALSRSISRLEEECGGELFQRAGRGICLNDNGRLLLRRVERMLAELEDARRKLRERGAKLHRGAERAAPRALVS
jgi:DNA-binding transcriptional LysR family regulator